MVYPPSYLYFLGINTSSLQANVYIEKIHVTSGTFHGIPRESVASLFIPCHRKYNTINATYARRMMARLDVISSII